MVTSERPIITQMEAQKGSEETIHAPTPVRPLMALSLEQMLIHRADFDASDDSLKSSSDSDEDYPITSTVATPPTPISSKASPRHPSDILKVHRCTYADCDKSFNRPAKLAQHLRSHTNTRPFLCPHPLCSKDFLRESHLKHHVKSAHSDVRDYVCERGDCGKRFVNATRLKRHYAAHDGREKCRCTVTGCGQTFRKHGTLQKHVLTVHEGRKPFICEFLGSDGTQCGAGFDTKGQQKSHAERVHEPKTFMCIMCPPEGWNTIAPQVLENQQVLFSTHAALQEHIKNEHPPACTKCGQICKSLRDLKSHLEVIHGELDVNIPKAHSCHEEGCGRGFTKKGNLTMHIQISHNPNRFVCGGIEPSTLSQVADWDQKNSCGKALTTKASMEEHIRTAHLGFAPSRKRTKQTKYGVSDEDARKNRVSILTRLTGTGYEESSGRDIPCLVVGCNHRFLREYDLEVHLRSRHGLTGLGLRETLMDEGRLYNRQTLQERPKFATMQDVDDKGARDRHVEDDVSVDYGHQETLGAGALRAGDFWLGGQSCHDRGESGEWVGDELEMRYLIDGSLGMERQEMIDGQEVDIVDRALA